MRAINTVTDGEARVIRAMLERAGMVAEQTEGADDPREEVSLIALAGLADLWVRHAVGAMAQDGPFPGVADSVPGLREWERVIAREWDAELAGDASLSRAQRIGIVWMLAGELRAEVLDIDF